jgi:hypothetical protein
MSNEPASASRNAGEPENLDKVTNPLVLLVAGELPLDGRVMTEPWRQRPNSKGNRD